MQNILSPAHLCGSTKRKLRISKRKEGPPSKPGQTYRVYCYICTEEQHMGNDPRSRAHPQYRIHCSVPDNAVTAVCKNGHKFNVHR